MQGERAYLITAHLVTPITVSACCLSHYHLLPKALLFHPYVLNNGELEAVSFPCLPLPNPIKSRIVLCVVLGVVPRVVSHLTGKTTLRQLLRLYVTLWIVFSRYCPLLSTTHQGLGTRTAHCTFRMVGYELSCKPY